MKDMIIKKLIKYSIVFYKIVLGVKIHVNYCWYGCYPLSILCLERSMSYFLKVVNCETLIPTVFIEQIESNIKTYWAKRVFNILNMLCLGYFRNNATISLKDCFNY